MGKHDVRQGLDRNIKTLTVLTVLFVGSLAIAPAKSHFSQWRRIQHEYNDLAREQGVPTMDVGLKQIWRADLGRADRCTTCHVAMGEAKPLANGGPLYGRHPEVHHEVDTMGCTLCHQGQGRATTEEAAHGHVAHWNEPMLPEAFHQASCGGCHGDAARAHSLATSEVGSYLFELHGCGACHVVDGEGGDVGPDLSGVALKGYDRDWHERHLRDPVATVEGSLMMSFGHLRDDEMTALLDYLDTLVGAPKLLKGKALAMDHGCRGCHRIGGVGGDVGVDLTEAAATTLHSRDFSGIEGEHDLETWQRQHLRHPARVSPGSVMPPLQLEPELEDALLTYILSIRELDVPMEDLPDQTLLIQLQGERDFITTGPAMYQMLCSTCHGTEGEGQLVESMDTTAPAVRNADMLAVASDGYLLDTLEMGRPGRNMPSWGVSSGLSEDEVDEILAFLEGDVPTPTTWKQVESELRWAKPAAGEATFGHHCAGCHGLWAEGTDMAPSLTAEELLLVADGPFWTTTIAEGRSGTAMPAHPWLDAEQLAELVTWLSTADTDDQEALADEAAAALYVHDPLDYRATGSTAYGAFLFQSSCEGCHGTEGLGLHGPAIAGEDFLRTASDGFIATTVVLGRSQRAMKSFGPYGITPLQEREIADIITFLRQTSSLNGGEPHGATVQGNADLGDEAFHELCSGCHGAEASGRTAPALANSGFHEAASDGFMQATIARGRDGTAMRAWAFGGQGFAELTPTEINDIVAYIRSTERF
jgi:mono/diheme cytochrome c family protein